MTFLLDTNVVSFFLQAEREDELARAATRCSMALVDEVRLELERDRGRGGNAFKKWLGTSNIDIRHIEAGSNASATLGQLLNPGALSKDRGERASIALAASEETLTFVTHDKNGLWLALRELWTTGERVLGLTVFLRRLFDQGALEDPKILDEIVSIAVPLAQRPTWWASWRAQL